jgi:alpha-tubulin suppressor-like RCC1 family protein
MQTFLVRLFLIGITLGLMLGDAAAATATKISVGMMHACALTSTGGVECWGDNTYNQLGDGTTVSHSTPGPVSGLSSGVVAIAAGDAHTCAVTSVGAVLCWGDNSGNQIGDGTSTQRATPAQVTGLASGVADVVAGSAHTCVLTTGGGVRCWGTNAEGELGDGTIISKSTSVPVSGLSSGVLSIAAGNGHTCALLSSSGMKCWGDNFYGQIGDNTNTPSLTPKTAGSLTSGVAAIGAGGANSCAVTTTGALLCWGINSAGAVGDGTTTQRKLPTAVSGMSTGVASVEVGNSFTCAVMTTGAAKCWGNNTFGQVGDWTDTNRPTPVQVSGLEAGVAKVAAGYEQACALMLDGEIRCWGHDVNGELGIGTVTSASRLTPGPMTGLA